MNKLLASCLYTYDVKLFKSLRSEVKGFNSKYNGNNIIKDDIFNVIKNYSRMKEKDLEILRYPTYDNNLCAFTFVKNDVIFVYVNSKLKLSKQIFAAAHELYHIFCYLDGKNPDFYSTGSVLNSCDFDGTVAEKEDKMANAFAGLLLAPKESINEQMEMYGIDRNKIRIKDVVTLMDIFSVPFKAMILRLYEDNILDTKKADELLSASDAEIDDIIKITGRSKRWEITTENYIEFGSLEEKIQESAELDLLTEERTKDDIKTIENIKLSFMKNK